MDETVLAEVVEATNLSDVVGIATLAPLEGVIALAEIVGVTVFVEVTTLLELETALLEVIGLTNLPGVVEVTFFVSGVVGTGLEPDASGTGLDAVVVTFTDTGTTGLDGVCFVADIEEPNAVDVETTAGLAFDTGVAELAFNTAVTDLSDELATVDLAVEATLTDAIEVDLLDTEDIAAEVGIEGPLIDLEASFEGFIESV